MNRLYVFTLKVTHLTRIVSTVVAVDADEAKQLVRDHSAFKDALHRWRNFITDKDIEEMLDHPEVCEAGQVLCRSYDD